MSGGPSVFIRPLTGIRFVAAAWVLLYHLQGPLNQLEILGVPVFSDVVRVGRLGVDLFFALSGFILTHTYLTRLTPQFKWRASGHFLWLRLARIYPVHLVMIVVAGLAIWAQSRVSGDSIDRDWWNPWDLIKNILLIQEWGPNPQRGWNFVAWSLSMEWLAYLVFPLLILVIWRMHRRWPMFALLSAWVVVLLPLLVYATSTSDPYYTDNWGSTIRVLTEFAAGAVTYIVIIRLRSQHGEFTQRARTYANALGFLLPLAVIAGAVFLGQWSVAQPPGQDLTGDAEPLPPYFHLFLVPLLIAWIGALAVADRGMARGLATRALILGGFISYSLYMTHLVWFGLWRAGLSAAGISGGAIYGLAVIVLVIGALVIAYAMWRWVEEPAREWMRARVGARPVPTEEAGEAEVITEGPTDEVLPVDVPRDEPRV